MSSTVSKQLLPPYGAISWYASFFSKIERVKVDKVDREFLINNNIVPETNVSKVISGLKFLGLINEDGSATEKMRLLNVVGADFQRNLEKIVREAYAPLFEKVKDLEKALPEDIVNFFITEHKLSRLMAEQSAKIFVFLAKKAGISLSQSILEELEAKPEKAQVAKKPSKAKQEKVISTKETISLPEDVLARLEVKGVGHVDIKDKDTFEIAKMYIKYLANKLGITD